MTQQDLLDLPADEKKALKDSMMAAVAELPSPGAFARWLETFAPPLAHSLRTAFPDVTPENRGYLRVDDFAAPLLRSIGLVDIGSPCLGVFGMQVRAALIEGAN